MIKFELEGTDGAGKSTGLKYLDEKLTSRGFKVLQTREVGNPHVPICTRLRELVLAPDSGLSGEAMELIFSAMRLENDRWLQELEKSENKPNVVLSDRGWLSHLAYTDHNVSVEFVQNLYTKFIGNMTQFPDAIIYFSVSPEVALQRRVRRGEVADVIELKGVEFQDKVRQSFEKYINEYADKITIYRVDANQDIQGVQKQLDQIAYELALSGLIQK